MHVGITIEKEQVKDRLSVVEQVSSDIRKLRIVYIVRNNASKPTVVKVQATLALTNPGEMAAAVAASTRYGRIAPRVQGGARQAANEINEEQKRKRQFTNSFV